MSRPLGSAARQRRTRFALDTALPADPALIEADVLRLLQDRAPAVLAVRPSASPDRPPVPGRRKAPAFPRGAPDLVLLAPGGRTACVKIRTQAARPTREEAAFEDLCRQQGIPFAVVRSVEEAAAALLRFGFSPEGA